MNRGRILYHLVKADFLQRARSNSFLLTLGGALYIGYAIITEKAQVMIGAGYRGVYNSAWVGALMTISASVFLSLAGFYIVKNSVERDVRTRVGQILASTPINKSVYTVAKMISNFSVLMAMVGVLMLAALGMQLLRAEDLHISPWQIWSPFVLAAMPAMAVTAALAILFETIPLLRGGLGNVAYFFLWAFALASAAIGTDDFIGMRVFHDSMQAALFKVDHSAGPNFAFTIGNERAYRTLVWEGIEWTPRMLAMRFAWVLIAVALALAAAAFFHRFDPAFESGWLKRLRKQQKRPDVEPLLSAVPAAISSHVHLTPLARSEMSNRFVALITSEFRLMLKGLRWWWYAGAAGLWLGSLLSRDEHARQIFLLIAWIWPILLWSKMGCRETQHSTGALIFSSPLALFRQLPAIWAGGVALALLTGSGFALRLLMSGDWQGLLAWTTAALFIPSLALGLGVWSGSSKPFEALYVFWWYLGPAHFTPGMDFMGLTTASRNIVLYALFTAVLVIASYMGRWRKLAYAQ